MKVIIIKVFSISYTGKDLKFVKPPAAKNVKKQTSNHSQWECRLVQSFRRATEPHPSKLRINTPQPSNSPEIILCSGYTQKRTQRYM